MSEPRPATPAVLLPLGIVTLIWGSTWLVIRGQLGVVPSGWSVSYRFAVASLTLAGYAAWRGERTAFDRRGWGFAAALGLFQFCLNFNFVYRAEGHVTSGLVAVVYALLLVPNALLARAFLGQRMGAQFVAGSAVALVGVAALFVHEARLDPNGGSETMLGIATALCGLAAASVANVMQASDTARAYPMVPMLARAMLLGAAIDAAWAWATTGPPVFDPRPGYVAGVLYLGVAASAVAFTLYFGVIRVIGPARAAYSGVAVPVIAMLLSTVFEGYRWSLLAVAGAALVLAGLVVALRARRPAR